MANISAGMKNLGKSLGGYAELKAGQERDEVNYLRDQSMMQYQDKLAEKRAEREAIRREKEAGAQRTHELGVLEKKQEYAIENLETQKGIALETEEELYGRKKERGRQEAIDKRTYAAIDYLQTQDIDPLSAEGKDLLSQHINLQIQEEQGGMSISDDIKEKAITGADEEVQALKDADEYKTAVARKMKESADKGKSLSYEQAEAALYTDAYTKRAMLGAKKTGIDTSKIKTKSQKAQLRGQQFSKLISGSKEPEKVYAVEMEKAKTEGEKAIITAVYQKYLDKKAATPNVPDEDGQAGMSMGEIGGLLKEGVTQAGKGVLDKYRDAMGLSKYATK